MPTPGYQTVDRLLSGISVAKRRRAMLLIFEKKIQLSLNTQQSIGVRIPINNNIVLRRFDASSNRNRTVKIFTLSPVIEAISAEIDSVDFSYSYKSDELNEGFPVLKQLIELNDDGMRGGNFKRRDIYTLMRKILRNYNRDFRVELTNCDAAFLKEVLLIEPTKSKPGKKPKIFDDEFYDYLFLALNVKNPELSIKYISNNICDLYSISEPDESKWKYDRKIIERRVADLYKDLHLKRAK
ncbi:hypothetical protein [Bosea sp. PAMC 26642]|uniref:hypothetical protein n=1 Tax=Bosea sp. (strain PAMC 26642) TaxID=1792307 RepID=UPI000B037260|nr:hypothetical protein [Bosea sp. PAMC 26642]